MRSDLEPKTFRPRRSRMTPGRPHLTSRLVVALQPRGLEPGARGDRRADADAYDVRPSRAKATASLCEGIRTENPTVRYSLGQSLACRSSSIVGFQEGRGITSHADRAKR